MPKNGNEGWSPASAAARTRTSCSTADAQAVGRETPVTISLVGCNAANQALTGQQITAALSGPGIGKITAYTWSFTPSATVFKTYNENAASNQLVPLGPADLTKTDTTGNGISVNPVKFYDRKAESLTVKCSVSVIAPDGTSLSLSAKSPSISVLKPTASWALDPKTVTVGGTTVSNIVGFHDDSATSQSFGVNTTWYPVTISVPSPFSGGTGCFAQLVTPSASITRAATGKGAAAYSIKIQDAQGAWVAPGTGLDGQFPYAFGFTTDANGNLTGIAADSSWQAGGTGASGDNPKGQEIVPDVDGGGTAWKSSSISDKFTTWLMYKPGGGVWIPIKSATWTAAGNASGGPNNWSATGTYTAPVPKDTDDPPQWNTVISGQQYRP